MEVIASKNRLTRVVLDLDPSFSPNEELRLGYAKSISPGWNSSTTRGVIITTRMLAYSLSDELGIGHQMNHSPRFAHAFLSITPEKQGAVLIEWLEALFGEHAKLF